MLVRNCAAVRPARAGGATRRVFECFIREGERSQNFFVRGHVVGDVFCDEFFICGILNFLDGLIIRRRTLVQRGSLLRFY